MGNSDKADGVSYGRKRAKTACTTCRALKRKCSGQYPCSMCVQYEYECRFEGKPSQIQRSSPPRHESGKKEIPASRNFPVITSPPRQISRKPRDMGLANAGLIFPQALFTKLEDRAPNIGPYTWNLGLGFQSTLPNASSSQSLLDLMDRKDINRFINRYFDSFHVMYDFLDEQETRLRLANRIRDPKPSPDVFDAVLCGAIALGMAFSGPSSLQQQSNMVTHSHSILSVDSMFPHPSIEDAQGWLLRAFYMRIAGSYHAAWMASCTTLQVIEAAGLHLEPDEQDEEADMKQRLFWMSRILNSWISFEIGRSPAEVRGYTCPKPSSTISDGLSDHRNFIDLIDLWEFSTSLDPQVDDNPDLEDLLDNLTSVKPNHEEMILSQGNLVLCIFRRLHALHPELPPRLVDKLLKSLKPALDSAYKLVEVKQPWWHVVNLPFQFVCMLLALDTPQALSHIGQGIRVLQFACEQFNTPVTHGVLNVLGHLIRLVYEKKQEESAHLFGTWSTHSPQSDQSTATYSISEKLNTPTPASTCNSTAYNYQQTVSSIGELASVPPLFEGDLSWNDFLDGGLPYFASFSQEGPSGVSRP